MKKIACVIAATLLASSLLTSCRKTAVPNSLDSPINTSEFVSIETAGTLAAAETTSTTVAQTASSDTQTTAANKTVAPNNHPVSTSKSVTKRKTTTTTKQSLPIIPKTQAAPQQTVASDTCKIVNGIYTADDKSFEIKLPKDWIQTENPNLLEFQSPDCLETGSNMNIIISNPKNPNELTWESIENEFINAYEITIQRKERTPISIDGCPAIYLRYSFTMNNTSLTICQYMVNEPAHCYAITYGTASAPSSELISSFASSARSFKVLSK